MKQSNYILSCAGIVIVIAGMKIASSILVPFLLATFIAILTLPILLFLQKKNLPSGISVFIIILILILVGGTLSTLLGTSISGFSSRVPFYTQRISEQANWAITLINNYGIEIPQSTINEYFDPGTAITIIGNTLSGLKSVLTNTFLIILTVLFLLMEASGIPNKLKNAFPDSDDLFLKIKSFFNGFNRYLVIKTATSLLTGLLVYLWLLFFNIDFPVLWGLLAFMLNFVPSVGSILAAIPAILLAIIQFGFLKALFVLFGFLIINIILGSILEPRFLGKGLGLSPLIVFLSLIFWGWVLGPVGMLLSVPLTMIVKIALENNQNTKWISILIGSEK
jgi:AI-2 transport protein TqsA